MKRRLLATAGLALGLTASASAQDKNGQCTGSEDACRQVAIAIRDFENAFNKHDAASIASFFAEDAVLLPEGPMLSGRDAIQKFYADALDAGLTGLVFNVKETHILSDVAWSIGDWHVDGQARTTPARCITEIGSISLCAVGIPGRSVRILSIRWPLHNTPLRGFEAAG
jgi:uncharacterized protein (TIGR02246 family)